MRAECHVIWSNYDLDFESWRDDLQAEYPGKTEDALYALMYEINAQQLEDERMNLNIQLPGEILLIADIGRWNGRFPGYWEIKSGNIKDCLYTGMDYATFYVDKFGDLRCDAIHHDGTNHYLYRVFKRGGFRKPNRSAERENHGRHRNKDRHHTPNKSVGRCHW